MLLRPELGIASEVRDFEGAYDDLADNTVEVVELLDDGEVTEERRLAFRPVCSQSFYKPPKELVGGPVPQVEEFPAPAHETINYFMSDQERRETFIDYLRQKTDGTPEV